jgi:hypothetical protein
LCLVIYYLFAMKEWYGRSMYACNLIVLIILIFRFKNLPSDGNIM